MHAGSRRGENVPSQLASPNLQKKIVVPLSSILYSRKQFACRHDKDRLLFGRARSRPQSTIKPMTSRKILISGDVNGKLSALFKRVAAVNKSNGPFDLLLCTGRFFPETGDA
jgi:hypothetical protein